MTASALAALLLLGGCGGSDKSEAQKTVRQFVQAVDAHDADRFCDDLVTKAFVEDYTGATGSDARAQCKMQVRAAMGVDVRLISIGRTEVRGGNATVNTEIATQGQRHPQVFKLKKEGGRWRLTSGTPG